MFKQFVLFNFCLSYCYSSIEFRTFFPETWCSKGSVTYSHVTYSHVTPKLNLIRKK